jgi:hypothetical protein
MNAIDRPGTFRGKLSDWGVSESKGGFPQFVARFTAQEFFDETAGGYIPWAEYEQDIVGYFVLYTLKNGDWEELLNAKQIKKALGWSGVDFESLANGKYDETIVLFRVESHEFNGNTKLQVSWIDAADASPTATLQKYDASKLKGLTAKLGAALTGTAAPAKPIGRPLTPPKGKKAAPKATGEAKPAAPSTATPPPASPAPVPSAPSGNPPPASPTCSTKDEAWAAVNGELKAVSDEKLAEVWIAEVSKLGKAEDAFTPDDWTKVAQLVLNQTAKF